MKKSYKYIILGNGNAGLTALKAIREQDKDGSILMVSAEGSLTYSRPLLTKTPLRNYELSRTILYTAPWYEEQGVDVLLSTEITALNTSEKTVEAGGELYGYEKCIYALGAYNFIPPIKGSDKKEVTSIRTYEDIYNIKRLCVTGKNAVIIGGGVIGLEAAFELTRYGMNVVVLEALPMLMPRLLDEDTANTLQKTIKSFSIETAVSVQEIAGEDKVEAVLLADGRSFPADFVIISAGVRANTKLAQDAGIEIDRAIVINEKAETSAKDVYACGDCCQYGGINYALWSQATEQALAAGTNAAGGSAVIGTVDSSMVLNTDEIAIFAVGDTGKNKDLTYKTEIEDNLAPNLYGVNKTFLKSYTKKFFVGDKLVGATIIGNLAAMQSLKEEILGLKAKED